MKNRNPIAVALLPFITFGIYGLVWQVKTKNEMNTRGADIPTAWFLIIPIVSYYWLWKYSEGVESVTGGKITQVLSFVLVFLLGSIGAAVIQNEFNNASEQPAQPIEAAVPSPVEPVQPAVAAAPTQPVSPVFTPEQPVNPVVAPEAQSQDDDTVVTPPQTPPQA